MNEIEILQAYYSSETLIQPEKMYRFSKGGNRYYYNEQNSPKMGITSFLSNVVPMPKFLDKWRHEIGLEEANNILKSRADYGTLFHLFAAEILRYYTTSNKVDFDFDNLFSLVSENSIGKQYDYYQKLCIVDELKMDLVSFIDFMLKTNMKAMLIETPISSSTMDLAATLDFAGYLDVEVKGFFGEVYKSGERKGEPKESKKIERVLAIIDFKTQRKTDIETDSEASAKQISLTNKLQLNYQNLFFQQKYQLGGGIKMYNLIPSNWRTNPAMQLTEVEEISFNTLQDLYNVSKVLYPHIWNVEEKTIPVISGRCTENINQVLKLQTIKSYLHEKQNNKF